MVNKKSYATFKPVKMKLNIENNQAKSLGILSSNLNLMGNNKHKNI